MFQRIKSDQDQDFEKLLAELARDYARKRSSVNIQAVQAPRQTRRKIDESSGVNEITAERVNHYGK